jgi:hypothetical protein
MNDLHTANCTSELINCVIWRMSLSGARFTFYRAVELQEAWGTPAKRTFVEHEFGKFHGYVHGPVCDYTRLYST